MRYLVTPDFSQKVVSTPDSVAVVGEFVRLIEGSSKDEILSDRSVSVVADGVLYTYQHNGIKIFFSFGTDDSGEYLLAADIVVFSHTASANLGAKRPRDPSWDGTVNPNLNGKINPNFNGQINPKINGAINPTYNGRINPNFNGQLNPRFNSYLNYKFNSVINPKFNPSIDPQRNWAINPTRNKALPGPFVYDLKAKHEGFVVKANDTVSLVFSMRSEFKQVAVSNGIGGYLIFDLDNAWREYWVRHEADGFLRFNVKSVWIGFVVN